MADWCLRSLIHHSVAPAAEVLKDPGNTYPKWQEWWISHKQNAKIFRPEIKDTDLPLPVLPMGRMHSHLADVAERCRAGKKKPWFR